MPTQPVKSNLPGAELLAGAPGRYVLPLMETAPAWNGRVDPAAWRCAAGFDGLSGAAGVDPRRAQAYAGATRTHLCFAVVSAVHPLGISPDDALELFIAPPAAGGAAGGCRVLVHADGTARVRSGGAPGPAQGGDLDAGGAGLDVRSSVADGEWHCRVLVPCRWFGRDDVGAGDWGLDVCRVFQRPHARAALGSGAPEGRCRFVFTPNGRPGIHLVQGGHVFGGDIRSRLRIFNPGSSPLRLSAQFLLRPARRPDVPYGETVTVPSGETREVEMKVEALAAREFQLFVRVRDEAGSDCYTRQDRYARQVQPAWAMPAPPRRPVDFQLAYYPYLNRMRIKADVSALPAAATLERMRFTIRPAGGGAALKDFALEASQFQDGVAQAEFELPPLEGDWEVVARAEGGGVPAEPRVRTFTRKVFEWERNGLGRSRTVYPPFQPIGVEGRTLRTVLKRYRLSDIGLLDSIVTEHAEGHDAQELLAAPMRYGATVEGRGAAPAGAALAFESVGGDKVVARSRFTLGGLPAEATSTLEYDGMLRVDLTLKPGRPMAVERLDLEIPLRGAVARMVHAANGLYRDAVECRTLPAGEGRIWSAADIPPTGWEANFCGYVFLGDAARGLCWFAESSRGWSRRLDRPSLDVARRGEEVTLTVHFIDRPTTLSGPLTLTFGLLAAPVKPRLPGWRHRWYTERFSVLGCDGHWLSLGNYGGNYPPGKDLALWEAVRRGNREALSEAEVEQVIARGRPHYERYGRECLRQFVSMAHMNLRNRAGRKMIFYFNRDATAGGEEFQTFMDEWSTHDYPGERRGVDSAAGVGIMPTDSYMDFALYWYAKSFDVAGNTGVYMDNLYFRPFANTLMSGAFRREDGSLAPSNGIWELREQAKRTFTFMCERGMEPIHMAHMTSLELLPILAFYTVQYDWEWQRGRGDVHDRFSREYLQLVSLGEAAGAWPIVLHELGRHEESLFSRYDYAEVKKILETYNGQASDPRVLRTFLGVTLVHELLVDPYFWHYEPIREGDTPENRLFETFRRPVLDFVQKPGVDVYRYWDARPQPASTNDPALPTIVFVRKGQEALCVVTNFAAEPRSADLRIDAAALGFDGGFRMIDLETGGEVPAAAGSAPVAIGRHDLREFRILPA